MKIVFFLFLTLSCHYVLAFNDNLIKLDPVLKPLIIGQGSALGAPVLHQREPNLINTIIKVSSNPMAIESAGARVRSVIGNIVTADVPLQSLNALINRPEVVYVQAARSMQPALLDVSVPDTKADQVWKSTPGYTGKGVIAGIIDTGIDWKHPDFKGKDGKSRVLYIWDQIMHTPGQYPAGYLYGTEWTKAQIDAGQCREIDIDGHGTHVTSVAAGSGSEFTGMAPDADIIVVKTSFSDSDVLDAVVYIFSKADSLGKPAVVNMSFGNHLGPHDGTDLIDQALDELLNRPGRAVVASAGNDGGISIHFGTPSLNQTVGKDYPWHAIRPFPGAPVVPVQIWYDPKKSISVRLLLPKNSNGDLEDAGIGWVNRGEVRVFIVQRGPLAGAQIVIDAQQVASKMLYPNLNNVYIHIYNNDNPGIPVDEYIYAIEYDASGVKFDAYVPYYGVFTKNLPDSVSFPNKDFLLEGDGDKTIISPSSASKVISVASYGTKSRWIDSEYRIRTEDYLKIDGISAFSSRGPLLNDDRKPEIAAPGEMIVGAFSSEGWDRARSIYTDGSHAAWRGTSMSSPHVAGAIALIYQQNPNLTALEIKNILASTATDRGPAGWDKAWGYGKLNVLAAMDIPSTPLGIEAAASDGAIAIKWIPNQESDVAGYEIYIDSAPPLDAGNVTTYTLENITNPVSISVSAYKANGSESPRTREITIAPELSGQDKIPPKRPEGLSVLPVDTALYIKWTRGHECDLSGYKIYYGASSGNYDQTLNAGDTASFMLEKLTNGSRVYFVLTAYDTAGNESGKSEELSAVPQVFPRTELRYQSGWPVKMKHDVYSSPTIYDVDGDGRKEIAITARNGEISLLSFNGRYMQGWPISTGAPSISSPAVFDVDNDGKAEIIAGSGEMIYMWRYDGVIMSGWPVKTGGSVTAAPVLGDIDGDGKIDVLAGSRDGRIYALKSDGSFIDGWPVRTRGQISSSPAIGDVDGDYQLEVVTGSSDGNMYVFNNDGTIARGWPVKVRTNVLSSPVIGDINYDGGLEIVAADSDGMMYVWRSDGSMAAGWPVNLKEGTASSPVIGDIDKDRNSLEIIVCTENGLVYVLKNDGTIMNGWPAQVMDMIKSPPALGDIDGDGKIEIIVGASTGLRYIGLVYAFNDAGKKLGAMFPTYTEGNICNSSPALGDLDGDGDIELVIGSCRSSSNTGGQLHVWDIAGQPAMENILWSGLSHDSRHTGVADDKNPPSFLITVLQNTVLKKYLDIYAVASEPLGAMPEMVIKTGEAVNKLPFKQIDLNIYRADYTVELSGSYTITVSGIDVSGNSGSSSKTVLIKLEENQKAPSAFALLNNYPNPFNPGTWIPYELTAQENVTIDIYDASGQLVRTLSLGNKAPGSYISRKTAAYWDGRDNYGQEASCGIYFCVLRAGEFRAIRKMSLLK